MKRPSFQFYPGDWMKDPSLGMCSPSARGIWIDLLCCIHELNCGGRISGTPDQLARLCRCTPEQFTAAADELSTSNAADVTSRNGVVTVVCRRMRIEFEGRESTKERVKRHREGKKRPGNGDGDADCSGDCNENVTPYSSSSTSTSVHPPSARARAGPVAEEPEQPPSPQPSPVAHGGFMPQTGGFAEIPSLAEWLLACEMQGIPRPFAEEKFNDFNGETGFWVRHQPWRNQVPRIKKWLVADIANSLRDRTTGEKIYGNASANKSPTKATGNVRENHRLSDFPNHEERSRKLQEVAARRRAQSTGEN